jgi:hypothetical protein
MKCNITQRGFLFLCADANIGRLSACDSNGDVCELVLSMVCVYNALV